MLAATTVRPNAQANTYQYVSNTNVPPKRRKEFKLPKQLRFKSYVLGKILTVYGSITMIIASFSRNIRHSNIQDSNQSSLIQVLPPPIQALGQNQVFIQSSSLPPYGVAQYTSAGPQPAPIGIPQPLHQSLPQQEPLINSKSDGNSNEKAF
ncbi:hypothetical protein TrispH2_011075 [Trichoplax sp. H2]|nr:hypothetical protein TrispH2_011075 [Trichoplax sp. H2]|eukprot:RDD36987.1 hypothetical protein TrispH2_011075 [Trichoplax sp. H2]